MANVIGRTQGYNARGPKAGEATRLGAEYVRSEANTWRTFVSVETQKTGECVIVIKRDGHKPVYVSINAETDETMLVQLDMGGSCQREPLVVPHA